MSKWLGRLFQPHKGIEPSTADTPKGDQAGVWRAAFEEAEFLSSAPRRIQEAQSQIINHLGRAYQAHERLGRQYSGLLQGVIQLADLCDGLAPAPVRGADGDGLGAVRRAVIELLQDHGVARWEPQPGEMLGEGCEVMGTEAHVGLPEGAVASVVSPGYRWQNGQMLRRARVTICRAAPTPVEIETVTSSPQEVSNDENNSNRQEAVHGDDDHRD